MAWRMKDVAERAGVSVTTVSHILNSTPHRPIADATRRRVLEVVRALNYRPDPNARRLAGSRSDQLALIVSEIANPFFADVIRAFETAALEEGFDVLLHNTEYQPERIKAGVRKIIESRVRGVAVLTSVFGKEFVEQLQQDQIPTVLLGSGPHGRGISTIEFGLQGLLEAIDHLLGFGHERIAFVSGPPAIHSAARSREIFTNALEQRGSRPAQIVESNYKVDGGMSAVRALLDKPPLPTGILCGNDLIALGVISALEEVGVSVPEDVSVVGHDDILLARLARPPLTTVHVPQEKVGITSFQALQKMLKTKRGTGRQYLVDTHLVVRKSTAPRRKGESQAVSVR